MQGEKETVVFHDRNIAVGTDRRTMNFQGTANSVLIVCLSRGGRRKQILYLRFRNTGQVYRYFEFTAADNQAFLSA
ncbi:MAG TPA: hypothetical protein VFB04_14765, partial [Terriglobales bacterium]|nr:hypothetical protein [Terriglobales bacterium]